SWRRATDDDCAPRSAASLDRRTGFARTEPCGSKIGPQRPQLGKQALLERRSKICGTAGSAGPALVADDPFDRQHMLLPPGDHRVVDVEQLLGKLVTLKTPLRRAIDLPP